MKKSRPSGSSSRSEPSKGWGSANEFSARHGRHSRRRDERTEEEDCYARTARSAHVKTRREQIADGGELEDWLDVARGDF